MTIHELNVLTKLPRRGFPMQAYKCHMINWNTSYLKYLAYQKSHSIVATDKPSFIEWKWENPCQQHNLPFNDPPVKILFFRPIFFQKKTRISHGFKVCIDFSVKLYIIAFDSKKYALSFLQLSVNLIRFVITWVNCNCSHLFDIADAIDDWIRNKNDTKFTTQSRYRTLGASQN